MMKIGRCASVLSDAEKRIGTVKYRILFPSKHEVKPFGLISVKSFLNKTMM